MLNMISNNYARAHDTPNKPIWCNVLHRNHL